MKCKLCARAISLCVVLVGVDSRLLVAELVRTLLSLALCVFVCAERELVSVRALESEVYTITTLSGRKRTQQHTHIERDSPAFSPLLVAQLTHTHTHSRMHTQRLSVVGLCARFKICTISQSNNTHTSERTSKPRGICSPAAAADSAQAAQSTSKVERTLSLANTKMPANKRAQNERREKG